MVICHLKIKQISSSFLLYVADRLGRSKIGKERKEKAREKEKKVRGKH
jgi:hypothetical protein